MDAIKCALILCAISITGCATAPNKIGAAYVSPLKFKNYDCDQIAIEMDQVSRRTTELYYSLKKTASNDAWQMGLGIFVLWPMLLLIEGGDGPEAQEYAQLKGEYEALRKSAVEKKCELASLPPSPEDTIMHERKKDSKSKKSESK